MNKALFVTLVRKYPTYTNILYFLIIIFGASVEDVRKKAVEKTNLTLVNGELFVPWLKRFWFDVDPKELIEGIEFKQ